MPAGLERFLPTDLLELYEVHNYRHAAEVLATSCADELADLIDALRRFRITVDDITRPGGNESEIPKRMAGMLRDRGWYEVRIKGDLLITQEVHGAERAVRIETLRRENYLDGHKVDFVKQRVAFDLEWNSKDQTFDRDLYAFRAFSECGLVSAAVLLTRGVDLNPVFHQLGPGVKAKYGASTTWMGKLLYRLEAGRSGGCPVLAFGITRRLIADWNP